MTADRDETIDRVQHRIDVENQLLAQRTTWVVTSQAFMLSAYAILVTGSNRGVADPGGDLRLLVKLVPWTAAASLVLLLFTIFGALHAIKTLRQSVGPLEGLDHLAVIGSRRARMSGSLPPLLIPALFLCTWVAVLVF